MPDPAIGLLLKGVRQLTVAEQDEVMSWLLNRQIVGAEPVRLPLSTTVGDAPPSDVFIFPSDISEEERREIMQAPHAKLRKLPVRVPEDDYERLRSFAQQNGFTMAVVIRTLLERFLDQREAGG